MVSVLALVVCGLEAELVVDTVDVAVCSVVAAVVTGVTELSAGTLQPESSKTQVTSVRLIFFISILL